MARKSNAGFTLLELAIGLAITSILIGAMMPMITLRAERGQQAQLTKTLNAIELALMNYRKAYNRLPCPAAYAALPNTTSYGAETTFTAGTPALCVGALDLGTVVVSATNTKVFAGAVPTRQLMLPDYMMYDPWGGRITYAIDSRVAADNAFTTYNISNTLIGNIRVNDSAGNSRTTSGARNNAGILVLLSHGPNGHGAYQLYGDRKAIGSTNTAELDNCNCNGSAVTTAADNVFIQQKVTSDPTDMLNVYDDQIRYYMRFNFLSSADTN